MSARILIVDDHKNIRFLIQEVLDRENYETVAAESAREAEAVLAREAIDLVLLDIIMPGQNGFDLLEKLRKDYPDLKIIIVTAYQQWQHFKDIKDTLPVDGFVYKPFDLHHLTNSIKEVLEKPRMLKNNGRK